MTAIEPAQPTTNGLVSRQHVVTAPAVPAPSLGMFKPENLQIAEAMARASDLLPKAYVGKPGACLLAMDWAERNDVAILDVLANVSFVGGKPVIGARMQKKLAARAGYRTQKIEGDERSCTVAVFDPGNVELGRATYTIEMAQALGLISRSPVWKADPAQMLFHRATTRALDHFGPGELANLFTDVEPDTDVEPQTEPGPITDVPAIEAESQPVDVDDAPPMAAAPRRAKPAPAANDTTAETDLKAWCKSVGLSQGDAMGALRQLGHAHQTMAAVAADPHAVADLKDWAAQR